MNNEHSQTLKKVFNDYIAREDLSCRVVADKLGVSLQVISNLANHNRYSNRTAKAMIEKLGDEFKPFAYIKKCNKCGGEFYPGDMRQIQCEKCRGNGEVKIKEVNKKPKTSLGETERMAEKKEMSYGQFVGLQKLKKQKEENEKRYKLFILDKKRVDELEEEIAKLAKWLSYSPEEIQRIFYDKDIYAINKSKRKKARKAFVKSCIEHSYENISSMISKAEVELAFVNERIVREEEAFNSYDKLGVWRLEAIINDK